MRACGVEAAIGFGSLVCRIGPDERRDVVAFCGPHNMGLILPNGQAGFHCWLRYPDWIFDPCVGDWRGLDPVAMEQMTFGQSLDAPVWTVELPNYWLKRSAEVEAVWRPVGTPGLGEAWYAPFFGDPDVMRRRVRDVHEDIGPEVASAIEMLAVMAGFDRPSGEPTVYPLKFRSRVVRQQ
jgi:hypothetical protein